MKAFVFDTTGSMWDDLEKGMFFNSTNDISGQNGRLGVIVDGPLEIKWTVIFDHFPIILVKIDQSAISCPKASLKGSHDH